MRKREMRPCRVPCLLGQMGLADDDVVGAAVGAVAAAEVVSEKPWLSWGGMGRPWGWPEGQKGDPGGWDHSMCSNCGGEYRA
jgi:hypothetical protein